ncbi:CU044_5270 family protein [Kitasatospora sp. NPDC058048]|uniref:CU044_5270 family protein n=1 Tax=Kitasatospora sp. NPDC058048 TaxID=3346313 RepID=UPI0036DC0E23
MIRNSRRRTEPLDHAELARLLPAPADPQLAASRQDLLEEHLMSEIHRPDHAPAASPVRRPLRRPLRRTVLFAAPVAAAAALAVVVSMSNPAGTIASPRPVKAPVVQIEEGSTVQLASTVHAIAAAATARTTPQPGPGQFIYIKSQVSFMSTRNNADTGESVTWVQPLHDREVWKSPDGTKGWLDEPGYQDKGGITLDTNEPRKQLSYTWLAAQPADPDAFLKSVYSTVSGNRDHDQQAFNEIGSIIREQLVPSGLAASLYEAAGKIPGVVVVEHAQDASGRDGIALARLDPQTGERSEWIFDRDSHQYLGSRGVQVREFNGVKPGTVVERTTILTRAVVDAKNQRPGTGQATA